MKGKHFFPILSYNWIRIFTYNVIIFKKAKWMKMEKIEKKHVVFVDNDITQKQNKTINAELERMFISNAFFYS